MTTSIHRYQPPPRSSLGGLLTRINIFSKEAARKAFLAVSAIKEHWNPSGNYHDLAKTFTWKKESQGLIVLIHGFHGHPCVWSQYIKNIKSKHKKYELLVPYVPNRGNCSLEEATRPIQKLVETYIGNNPGKPVAMVGFSNGCRIASLIETRTASDVTLKVIALAGPFFGTQLMNLGDKLKAAKLIAPSFVKELIYNSQFSRDLVAKMKREDSPDSRYCFYASFDDDVVYPIDSSTPCLNKKEETTIYQGIGHNEVTKRARKDVLHYLSSWLASQKQAANAEQSA